MCAYSQELGEHGSGSGAIGAGDKGDASRQAGSGNFRPVSDLAKQDIGDLLASDEEAGSSAGKQGQGKDGLWDKESWLLEESVRPLHERVSKTAQNDDINAAVEKQLMIVDHGPWER